MSERRMFGENTSESLEARKRGIFMRIAREHPNEPLGEEEWRAFGLEALAERGEIDPLPPESLWMMGISATLQRPDERCLIIDFYDEKWSKACLGGVMIVTDASLPVCKPKNIDEVKRNIQVRLKALREEAERRESERYTQRLRCLEEVARTHLDEFLDPANWKRFQMGKIFAIDHPPATWFVTIPPSTTSPHEGRAIQLTILNDAGLIYDIQEYSPVSDQSIPSSSPTFIQSFEERVRLATDRERERETEAERTEAERYERERGFPAGIYTLTLLYENRKGLMQTPVINFRSFDVRRTETRDRVREHVGDEISMYGLHNQGDRALGNAHRPEGAPVHAVLRNEDGVEIGFDFRVVSSGHIL